MGQKNKKVRTSKHLIEAADRARKLCDLRVAGKSLGEAADIMGYASAECASTAISNYLERVKNECAQGMREVYHLRLEKLFEAYYEKALDGDIEAAKLYLKALDQGAKLLGLNAPTQQTTIINVDSAFIGMSDAELNKAVHNIPLDQLTDLGTMSDDNNAIDVEFE